MGPDRLRRHKMQVALGAEAETAVRKASISDRRTLPFISLVLVYGSFGTSLRDLVGQRNCVLIWISAVTVSMLALILALPLGRELFRFGPLHADDLLLVLAAVAGVVIVLEGLKRFWRTRLAR